MAQKVRDFNTQSLSPLSQAYGKVKTMWRNKAALSIMARKKVEEGPGVRCPSQRNNLNDLTSLA